MPVFFLLYLYFVGDCPIEIPYHFPTQTACEEAGDAEVLKMHKAHPAARGFRWCVQGGY